MAYFQQSRANPAKSTLVVAPVGSSVVPSGVTYVTTSIPPPHEYKTWFPFPLIGYFTMINHRNNMQYSDIPPPSSSSQSGRILATTEEANLILGSGVPRKVFCQSATFILANEMDGKEHFRPLIEKFVRATAGLPIIVKSDFAKSNYPSYVTIEIKKQNMDNWFLGFDCFATGGMYILLFQQI